VPYTPSLKTNDASNDRIVLDKAVERVAIMVAKKITNNLSLISEYERVFIGLAYSLQAMLDGRPTDSKAGPDSRLARAIYEQGAKYNYEGAHLGELNYAITRFIQRVPQLKVQNGDWAQEFRYWIYAATIEALILASVEVLKMKNGIGGVLEDIKDEYKRRVNTAYEAEQIMKNGDCYDTPYYTRLVKVEDEDGNHIGHQEVMLKRSRATLYEDMLLGVRLVLSGRLHR